MSEEDDGMLWPAGEAQIDRQRALLLWSLAREASSPTTRAEFERLALLYERLAERALRVQPELGTLGELLSAKRIKRGRFEVEWVEWLQGTARGDRRAFQTLYLWTGRFVFALMKAITKDQSAAEEATMIVFQDVWERAATYDATDDTVISWIMNQARSRALDGKSLSHSGRRRSQRTATGSKQAVLDAIGEAHKWHNPSSVTVIANEPDLNEPGPGISCKVLATDVERNRLSMFVRLAPGGEYPPHTHAGLEQLYLLLGELWIDDRKLYPGDYNRAEPGTTDQRVWSENGCTCILVTSSSDILT
ncbi:MAG: cupin domain-containing protein [Gammaproteobacteria bacterium]|nr:cupin domain-containing protein [Gammaproteobacteria bacterium]